MQVAIIIANKVSISISTEYFDFADVFSLEQISKFLKHNKINNHAIELDNDYQLLYGPIYSLGLVELETLKTYIKINLANGLIRPSKSLAEATIFPDKKQNKSFQLCVDY